MSINVKWDITYKCNLYCEHCINAAFLGDDGDLNTEQIRDVIKNMKEAGVNSVHLLGGEPLARKDILQIFKLFEDYKLNFGFNTNGLKIGDQYLLENIMNNNHIKKIVFSIEGPDSETNDKIRGKKVFEKCVDSLKKTIEMKDLYKRDDLEIYVNTVISKWNLNKIEEMIDFCDELKVDVLSLLQFIPEGNGEENDYSINAQETVNLIKRIALMDIRKRRIRIAPKFANPIAHDYAEVVLKKYFPETSNMCGAGDEFFYINNKGELFPCDRTRELIDKELPKEERVLSNNSFWEIASNPLFGSIFEEAENVATYKNYEPCNTCKYLQTKCYPCVMRKNGNEVETCKIMLEEMTKNEKNSKSNKSCGERK